VTIPDFFPWILLGCARMTGRDPLTQSGTQPHKADLAQNQGTLLFSQ